MELQIRHRPKSKNVILKTADNWSNRSAVTINNNQNLQNLCNVQNLFANILDEDDNLLYNVMQKIKFAFDNNEDIKKTIPDIFRSSGDRAPEMILKMILVLIRLSMNSNALLTKSAPRQDIKHESTTLVFTPEMKNANVCSNGINFETLTRSLSLIIKAKPKYMSKVIQAMFKTLGVLSPMLRNVQKKSIRKQIKCILPGLIKLPGCYAYLQIIGRILLQFGFKENNVTNYMFKLKKAKKRQQKNRACPAVKKPRIDVPLCLDEFRISPIPHSEQKLPELIELSEGFIAERLSVEVAVELVMSSMVLVPNSVTVPSDFINAYQPTCTSDISVQRQVVSKLLSNELVQIKAEKCKMTNNRLEVLLENGSKSLLPIHIDVRKDTIYKKVRRKKSHVKASLKNKYFPMKMKVKTPKLYKITQASTHDDRNKVSLMAVERILRMETNIIPEDALNIRTQILVKLAMNSNTCVKELILQHLTVNVITHFDIALHWLYEEYAMLQGFKCQTILDPQLLEEHHQSYNTLLSTLINAINNITGEDRDPLLARLYLEAPLITKDAIEALNRIVFEESRTLSSLQLLRDLLIRRPNKKLLLLLWNVVLGHLSHENNEVRENAVSILETPKMAWSFIVHSIINLYHGQSTIITTDFSKYILLCTSNDKQLKIKLCQEIVECIERYLLSIRTEGMNIISQQDLVDYYVSKFESFQKSSNVLSDACCVLCDSIPTMFKNKLYDIDSIYHLAMVSWRFYMLQFFDKQIVAVFLKLMEQERCGKTINAKLVTQVVYCYNELGKIRESNQFFSEIIYRDFESKFLRDTAKFYEREASEFLRYNSASEYIEKTEQWMKEEENRSRTYFYPITQKHLPMACTMVLIGSHLNIFYNEFENCLGSDRQADLARIYNLVGKAYDGLDGMKNLLENYITNQGLAAINKYIDTFWNDPKTYVDTILDIHNKFSKLILTSFNNDGRFLTSLDKACRKFINECAMTRATTAPELLAKYCDLLLQKSHKNSNEVELENALNQIMIVFNYVDDKDVFQKFYSKMLAKRLLLQNSKNKNAEVSMISKLKQACGLGYVSRLEKMIQDMKVSEDLDKRFQTHLENLTESLDLDFSIKVLSCGCWPVKQSKILALPNQLEQLVTRFKNFYSSQHSGRKLSFLYHLSQGEVITNCFKRRYTFQASTFQIAVLLQFNIASSWTLQELHESTQIEIGILRKIVEILLKAKLLVTAESQSRVLPSTSLHISLGYRNKKKRININVPISTEVKLEKDALQRCIGEDRKHIIQAGIVRIMKLEKTMKKDHLIAKVLNQSNSNFQPNISVIKNCIDILVDREYLKLDSEQRDVYTYVV